MTEEILQESELFPTPARLSGASEIQLAAIAINIVDRILETGNPLEVAEYMKSNEVLSSFIRADKRFVEYVREEADKYGKTGYTSPAGAVVKLLETGVKHDYGVCGDGELNLLLIAQIEADNAVKARQKFLQALPPEGLPMVDKESGEEYTLYPPAKTSTSSYSVSLKKK